VGHGGARDGNGDGGAPGAGHYSLGAVVKLTGLSEHTIRAWERRYGAVTPIRSPRGTRRFSADDVARLRLLSAAVEAGERIGAVARLSDAELEERLAALSRPSSRPADEVRRVLERLDLPELERILGLQLAALGPPAFAREVAAPLLREAGQRWERGDGSIAEEHLLSAVTRGLLGAALRAAPRGDAGPRILFTTPEGERHELGVLGAAVSAVGAGAAVTYLGPDLPVEEVVRVAHATDAAAVGLGIAALPAAPARRYLASLRRHLPPGIEMWVGGAGAEEAARGLEGVAALSLAALEGCVARLRRRPS